LVIALLLVVATIVAAVEIARYPVEPLAKRTPKVTAFMAARAAEARKAGRRYRVDQRWVPYSRISRTLRRAVLIAEDDAFFSHDGFDWDEIKTSARTNMARGRVVRGGSTITQQLAKNLFLGPARTPIRKIEEMLLAIRLERTLGKQRIFELYLNEIEWGDGIFGIEAAARRHFGVSAAELDARQSVLLAAVIINPRRYSVREPNRRIERRARIIAGRMMRRGFLDENGYRFAIGAPSLPPAETALADSVSSPAIGPWPDAPAEASSPDSAPPAASDTTTPDVGP
jgi:monofunctional glycosyltransferase